MDSEDSPGHPLCVSKTKGRYVWKLYENSLVVLDALKYKNVLEKAVKYFLNIQVLMRDYCGVSSDQTGTRRPLNRLPVLRSAVPLYPVSECGDYSTMFLVLTILSFVLFKLTLLTAAL